MSRYAFYRMAGTVAVRFCFHFRSSLSLFWYGIDVSLSRIWSGFRERNKEIRGRWLARERRGKRRELWRVDAREKVEVEREREWCSKMVLILLHCRICVFSLYFNLFAIIKKKIVLGANDLTCPSDGPVYSTIIRDNNIELFLQY